MAKSSKPLVVLGAGIRISRCDKTIKKFIDNIDTTEILNIIKKESLLYYIINIIKRYCAFYIYLGIAYYYKDGRDLYIINLIECSKNQKDAIIQINDFFNSLRPNFWVRIYCQQILTVFHCPLFRRPRFSVLLAS